MNADFKFATLGIGKHKFMTSSLRFDLILKEKNGVL